MENNVMHKVVKVLIQDSILIREYKKLCDIFGLSPLENILTFSDEPVLYEFFWDIVSKWVSMNGETATVQKLIEILERLNFKNTAERLAKDNEGPFFKKSIGSPVVDLPIHPSDFHPIVELLIEDELLVRNHLQLCHSLELKQQEFTISVFRFKTATITPYDLFHKVIRQWVSERGKNATINGLCQILQEEGFKYSADRLRTLFITRPGRPIRYEIERVTPNFTGRSDEVQMLMKMFLRESGLVTITGMAGVGKTELAKKFARKLFVEDQVGCIFLNGESPDGFRSSVLRLADKIGVSTMRNDQSRNAVDIFLDITEPRIKNQKRLVVIIDDLDKANEIVKHLISKLNSDCCFVIVTSRNLTVLDYAGEVIRLDVLMDEEAILFVQNSTGETESDINTLCKLLSNFPLTLQQAVAFIKLQKTTGLKGQRYKINDFFNDYESNKAKVFDFPLNKIEHAYTETTLTTWNMTIDQIRSSGEIGQLAIELLEILAFLEPENIQIDFLLRLYQESCETADKIKDAILLLKNHSLIKVEDHQISIHRLVQEIIRLQLSESSLEVELLRKLMKSMQGIVPTLKELEVGHILSIWKYGFKNDDLIQEFVHLPADLSQRLEKLTLFKEMLDFARKSEQVFEKVLGPTHLETLKIKDKLARALYLQSLKRKDHRFKKEQTEPHRTVLNVSENLQTSLISEQQPVLSLDQLSMVNSGHLKRRGIEPEIDSSYLQSRKVSKNSFSRVRSMASKYYKQNRLTRSSAVTKASKHKLVRNEIEIGDIVGVLLKAGEVMKNWTKLYKAVGLDEIKMLQLELLYERKKLQPFDLIARVVNLWVECNLTDSSKMIPHSSKSEIHNMPSLLTLNTIIQVMVTNGFTKSAGELRNRFGILSENEDQFQQLTIKGDERCADVSHA